MDTRGIFDAVSDEFHPGIPDKVRAVKDQMIYASQSPRAKQLPIEPRVEKGLNFDNVKYDSLPLGSMEARDLFSPILKQDMPIDPQQKKKPLMEIDPKKQTAKEQKKDDLMNVESKKWKEKFNLGFDV